MGRWLIEAKVPVRYLSARREPACSKLTVKGMDADKFVSNEFEQLLRSTRRYATLLHRFTIIRLANGAVKKAVF